MSKDAETLDAVCDAVSVTVDAKYSFLALTSNLRAVGLTEIAERIEDAFSPILPAVERARNAYVQERAQ